MERTLATTTSKKIGQSVLLYGWVNSRRDHGQLVFIDLRDRSGIVQLVCPKKLAADLRSEYVVSVNGEVKKRLEKNINPNLATGQVEVSVKEIKILAQAKTSPFEIDADGREVEETIRLKYRYLDLRRPRLAANLRLRDRVTRHIRQYLHQQDFVEIETPFLSKSTPEGARDFLVPSRLQPGNFYALPQSPQQYKQLLMVAGFERYFQIVRCFRDEDPRADRAYGEFTQLDLEMSFVNQEIILQLTEQLMIELTEKVVGKKVFKKPFPRLTHQQAMAQFGADKFDLRKDKDPNVLAFAWVLDFPLFETTETRELSSSHHPFTAPKDEDIPLLDKEPMKVRSWQHDLVCNGLEVGGGSIRITDPKIQTKIFQILGHSQEEINQKFGHLLEAFEYGVPPHGGIAPGIDRLMMVFANEANTREVMAFPITSGGQTAVMNAPAPVSQEQLKELGIKIINSSNGDISKRGETVFQEIKKLLEKNQVKYQTFEHKPVFTSEEAAEVRGTDIKQGAKALIMLADKKPIMLVVSAAYKVDIKKFKKLFKIKDLRMATAGEVEQLTQGVKIGAVPPFGNIFGMPTYVDKTLAENKTIAFNAGLHSRSIEMAYKDFIEVIKPRVSSFSR